MTLNPQDLITGIDQSDTAFVSRLLGELTGGVEAWKVHLAIYPVVQRVLNPPYINPHLPKMYRIIREFLPYLAPDSTPALIRLEINEYAQRPKLKEFPKANERPKPASRDDILAAIRKGESKAVASLLQSFMERRGKADLARELLLVGTGYLDQSLGHSVSCTAFILLEILDRHDQDPWPALCALADYFCKGGFHAVDQTPPGEGFLESDASDRHLLVAANGDGIVNLHHTITRYAIARVQHLLTDAEHSHLLSKWIQFIGSKEATVQNFPSARPMDHDAFHQYFSQRNEEAVLSAIRSMIASEQGRRQMGQYLLKGVCDRYRGSYNPHFLTGLASALWVVENQWTKPEIAMNAMRQYVNYYFTEHPL